MEMSPSLRCDAPHPKLNFRELRKGEVRRTHLLGSWVNRAWRRLPLTKIVSNRMPAPQEP